MRLECLGAVGEVTGSSYLVTSSAGHQILIDCGIFQGSKENEFLNYGEFNFDPKKLGGVILTHAHLDHSGRLPALVRSGYTGSIYMTPPTADLASLILRDQIKVQQRREKSFYSPRDLVKTLNQIVSVPYNQAVEVSDYLVNFRNAGHILGSASIEIREKGSRWPTTVFSGDIGNDSKGEIKNADIVVMESTYGDRNHQMDDPKEVIRDEINRIEKQNRGTLLIPAFSVDRTQTLLSIICDLKKSGQIDRKTPVFLDSPMGILATNIYRRYLNGCSTDENGGKNDPYRFEGLVPTYHHKASEGIPRNRKKVVIAGSGMMEGGRIRRHAADYLPDKDSRILFVGYAAEDTLGRDIIEGAKEVLVDERIVQVNASVGVTGSLSSHADQTGLLDWLHYLNQDNPAGVREVLLVHGGETQRKTLADRIGEELCINVTLPKRNLPIVI